MWFQTTLALFFLIASIIIYYCCFWKKYDWEIIGYSHIPFFSAWVFVVYFVLIYAEFTYRVLTAPRQKFSIQFSFLQDNSLLCVFIYSLIHVVIFFWVKYILNKFLPKKWSILVSLVFVAWLFVFVSLSLSKRVLLPVING